MPCVTKPQNSSTTSVTGFLLCALHNGNLAAWPTTSYRPTQSPWMTQIQGIWKLWWPQSRVSVQNTGGMRILCDFTVKRRTAVVNVSFMVLLVLRFMFIVQYHFRFTPAPRGFNSGKYRRQPYIPRYRCLMSSCCRTLYQSADHLHFFRFITPWPKLQISNHGNLWKLRLSLNVGLK